MPLARTVSAVQKSDQILSGHPLAQRNRAAAWGRYLGWQARGRLSKSVRHTWLNGLQVSVEHGITGFTGNIYAGLHEAVDMLFVLHFLRPGDLFADVEANIGSYTLLASGVVGAEAGEVRFTVGVDTFNRVAEAGM